MKKRKLLLALGSMLVFMTSVFLMGEQKSNAQDCNVGYYNHKKTWNGCKEKQGWICFSRCPNSQESISLN